MATKKIKPGSRKILKNETVVTPQKDLKKKSPGNTVLPANNWKFNAGIFLLLVLGTLALYSSNLQQGFFPIDDEGYILKNPWIKEISFQNIVSILKNPFFLNYSPMHLFSYMLDYSINGEDPYIFHLSSNLWAGIVGGFVFLTARALTKNLFVSIAAASLFIVHPAHVEAVTWISSRKDLVAAAFALPSLLAYLEYRKKKPSSMKWFILSVVLFVFALAGKVSVATFPAVYFIHDVFVEKREFKKSLIDKLPYLLAILGFGLMVYSAQPLSGNNPSFYVIANALVQSLWLMTGFGDYVIFRLRPEDAGTVLEITSVLFLLVIFSAPLLLRNRWPLGTLLIYWLLIGLLPAQVLSFVHPVTDRYLFFPSIAAVILISIAIHNACKKFNLKPAIYGSALAIILAGFWVKATLSYLSEWSHPLSVWYAAKNKSADPDVPYGLAGHYLDVASTLGVSPRTERPEKNKLIAFANAIWKNDPRLPALISEWDKGQIGGPAESGFQTFLLDLAWADFEKARQTQGSHIFPTLFFKRGVVLLDKGDLEESKKEFLMAIQEASFSTVVETRSEVAVGGYHALGAIEWKKGNYPEALNWFEKARAEQNQYGIIYIPDIDQKINRMKQMSGMASGNIDGAADASTAYNQGLFLMEAAAQLGTNPRVPFSLSLVQGLAKERWKNTSKIEQLNREWETGIHGGPAELEFQSFLRDESWKAFENAVALKGTAVMSNLYFRRGMLLGETGNYQKARQEFMRALEEAEKEPSVNTKKEITVLAYDALGLVSWFSKDYSEALKFFTTAQEKQSEFGGNWVPDIANKIQQMKTMSGN